MEKLTTDYTKIRQDDTGVSARRPDSPDRQVTRRLYWLPTSAKSSFIPETYAFASTARSGLFSTQSVA